MDIALEYPNPPNKPHGLWPSIVAVTTKTHPPTRFNHQESLEFYRVNQDAYGILWMDAPNHSVYRLFPNTYRGSFAPDFRVTERGEYELVGLWSLPNQPPSHGADDSGDDDGGSPVPSGPLVGHPSGRR